MRTTTLAEAQDRLSELIDEARDELIALTDSQGKVVAFLAGVTADSLEDVVMLTPGFREMISASRASLRFEEPVSAEDLLAEANAEIDRERAADQTAESDRSLTRPLPAA